MTAHIRWNPRRRTITLEIGGEYTLDEIKQVNTLIGELCAAPTFDYAYMVIHADDVQRPSYSAVDAIKHTSSFRDNDLRLMVVYGLSRRFQVIGAMFRAVIENAVGMPVRFVDSLDDAHQMISAIDAQSTGDQTKYVR
jgi:hypothetical protein